MKEAETRSASPRGSTALLLMLAAAYCLAYVDRLMMAVVAEPVKAEFQLSDTQLFLLTGGAFVIIYGVLGLVAGWLVDRYDRSRLVAASVAIWSVCTVFCGFAGNFLQLALARATVGVGEAAITPAAISIISDNYTPRQRPMATAVFYTGGMMGILVAWAVGGIVAQAYGWRYAFFVAGPPGLILSLLIWWKGVDARQLSSLPASQMEGSAFMEVWRNRPLTLLITAGAISAFVNVGLVTQMGSFFIRSHGMSVKEVGLIFGPLMAVGMSLGMMVGGWIGNRIAARGTLAMIRFSAWNVLILIPIYLVIFLAPTRELALIATFVGTFVSVLYPPAFVASYQAVSAPHTRGTAAGICSCLTAVIGGALTTVLVGALSDYLRPTFGIESLRYAMIAGLLSCLIAGLMFLYVLRLLTRDRPDLRHS